MFNDSKLYDEQTSKILAKIRSQKNSSISNPIIDRVNTSLEEQNSQLLKQLKNLEIKLTKIIKKTTKLQSRVSDQDINKLKDKISKVQILNSRLSNNIIKESNCKSKSNINDNSNSNRPNTALNNYTNSSKTKSRLKKSELIHSPIMEFTPYLIHQSQENDRRNSSSNKKKYPITIQHNILNANKNITFLDQQQIKIKKIIYKDKAVQVNIDEEHFIQENQKLTIIQLQLEQKIAKNNKILNLYQKQYEKKVL